MLSGDFAPAVTMSVSDDERLLRRHMAQHWPSRLWIVRHGESAGNVARDAAHAQGAALIDIQARDVDVPLSQLGEQQAAALGRWFASLHPRGTTGRRVDLALSSGTRHCRRRA